VKYYETLDKPYTTITILITNHLVWNETGSPAVSLGFTNLSYVGEGTEKYLSIYWTKAKDLKLIVREGSNEITVANTTYVNANFTVKLCLSDNKLSAFVLDNTKNYVPLISGFSYNTPLVSIITWGAENSTTDGYVQCDVGAGVMGSFSVTEWLPAIISLAMLGMVVGLMKKISG